MPLFTLELMGDPAIAPNKAVDRRLHAGSSVADATQTATNIVLNHAGPGTFGFRLLDQNGQELHRWYKTGHPQETGSPQVPANGTDNAAKVIRIATGQETETLAPEESHQLNSAKQNLRVLVPGDEAALESHLARHWSSSMILLANLRAGGLVDEGKVHHGTYAAAWNGATILGLAAHYWDGSLVLQAPRGLGPVARAALAASGRPVTGIMGPWPQVEAAVAELGIPPRRRGSSQAQILLTLDTSKLAVPDAVKRNEARHRLAVPADLDGLLSWRVARDEDLHALTASTDYRDATRAILEKQIAVQGLYIAESKGAAARRLAIASYDVYLPDAVQIGGVYALPVPKDQKDKGYAAVAVAGAVAGAVTRGIKRIALLAERSSQAALASYRALGFKSIDDFGYLSITASDPSAPE